MNTTSSLTYWGCRLASQTIQVRNGTESQPASSSQANLGFGVLCWKSVGVSVWAWMQAGFSDHSSKSWNTITASSGQAWALRFWVGKAWGLMFGVGCRLASQTITVSHGTQSQPAQDMAKPSCPKTYAHVLITRVR